MSFIPPCQVCLHPHRLPATQCKLLYVLLRQLRVVAYTHSTSKKYEGYGKFSVILIGSAMFGATFHLVSRVGVP